ALDRRRHLLHHLLLADDVPVVPAAPAESDLCVKRGLRLPEELVEQIDGIVKEVIVRVAYPNVQLAAELRRQYGGMLLQSQSQVVLLPVLQHFAVELPRLAVPQRHRMAVGTARAEHRVPGAPVLARQRPAVAPAKDDFTL